MMTTMFGGDESAVVAVAIGLPGIIGPKAANVRTMNIKFERGTVQIIVS
jgi:hypothetical protein